MITEIIEAISVNLNAEFGYETYMEEIKQELTTPCFFIQALNPTHELFRLNKYFRTNDMVIQYFPQSKTDYQRECNGVAERMRWCLEYITLYDSPNRGTEMKWEVIDGVLNFFVNYDVFEYRIEEQEVMETMEDDQNVR